MMTLQTNGNLVVVGSKTWSDAEKARFVENAPPISIKVNGQPIAHVKPKLFSTGSCGYNMTGKVLLDDVKLDEMVA